jgi:hypothetical protein
MNEDIQPPELTHWFSTYGILTSQSILAGYNIHLSHDDLVTAIKSPNSIYYHLLRVPLKNVFNGIIMQQVHDYQVYLQKTFIDFLVSGQGDKEEGSPGTDTRETLDEERTKLIELSDRYNQEESVHHELIAESQASLISLSGELQKFLEAGTTSLNKVLHKHNIVKDEETVKRILQTAIVYYEQGEIPSTAFWDKIAQVLEAPLNEEIQSAFLTILQTYNEKMNGAETALQGYFVRAEEVDRNLKSFRREFYQLILRINDLIQLLPDYKPNPEEEAQSRSALDFDAQIGEGKSQP